MADRRFHCRPVGACRATLLRLGAKAQVSEWLPGGGGGGGRRVVRG